MLSALMQPKSSKSLKTASVVDRSVARVGRTNQNRRLDLCCSIYRAMVGIQLSVDGRGVYLFQVSKLAAASIHLHEGAWRG